MLNLPQQAHKRKHTLLNFELYLPIFWKNIEMSKGQSIFHIALISFWMQVCLSFQCWAWTTDIGILLSLASSLLCDLILCLHCFRAISILNVKRIIKQESFGLCMNTHNAVLCSSPYKMYMQVPTTHTLFICLWHIVLWIIFYEIKQSDSARIVHCVYTLSSITYENTTYTNTKDNTKSSRSPPPPPRFNVMI